jgi:peptidoglycan/LPS O-acetylase OafA/YrhL
MTATVADPVVHLASERPTLRYMPALDGLRGIAVAGVLLFHAGHLVGGFLGVDLFFVLSGFLITSLLLRESADRSAVNLKMFWIRRARRLLPALGGVLLGVAAYAWLLADARELERIRLDGLATIAYVANWRFVLADQSYWDLFVSPSPLQHMWSVAIEEQFYVVWPLLFVVLLRTRAKDHIARTVLVGAPVLALASLALMIALYESEGRTRVYFGTDTRAASILVGITLAAWFAVRGQARSAAGRAATEGAGIAGAVILLWAWTRVDGQSELLYQGGMLALAVAGVAVIAAVASPEPGPLGRALSIAPLRWLGQISYGVYLWHWPIYLVLDADRTGLDGWPLVGVRVAVTVVVSAVSYVLFEQPVRHGRVPRAQLRVLAPAASIVVVAALLLGTVGAEDPPDTGVVRPDDVETAVAAAAAAPPGAEQVMVVGNSVGLFLGKGFQEVEADPPVVAFNRGVVACNFPFPQDMRLGDGTPWPDGLIDCAETWEADVERLRPHTVVIALSDTNDSEFLHDGEWTHPCTPGWDDRYRVALDDAVRRLSRHGATVAIVSAAYNDIPNAPVARLERTDCQNAVNAEVAAANPDAVLVDLAGYLCSAPGVCRDEIDGVELRPDGLHYMGEGAEVIARWILDEVRRSDG